MSPFARQRFWPSWRRDPWDVVEATWAGAAVFAIVVTAGMLLNRWLS